MAIQKRKDGRSRRKKAGTSRIAETQEKQRRGIPDIRIFSEEETTQAIRSYLRREWNWVRRSRKALQIGLAP